jgi:hypothetical protein
VTAGRPTDYKAEYAEQAEKLCIFGATNYELAEFFGVSDRTIARWCIEHEKFCHAVKAGKEKADSRVEKSLYDRAVGYTFEAEEIFSYQGEVTRVPTVKHIPPDPGAAMNWLKNRRSVDWKEKIEQNHTGDVTIRRLVIE